MQLLIGLLSFILQVFIFEAPYGIIDFLLCLISIYLIIGSITKLCQLSTKIKNSIFDILDILLDIIQITIYQTQLLVRVSFW